MKPFFLAALSLFVITFFSCNGNNEKTKPTDNEIIVKDSSTATATPNTNHVDSIAADTANHKMEASSGTVQTTTENFENAKGEKLKVAYKNAAQMSIAELQIGEAEPIKLMQKEAWAKGAEYTNGKITWRVEGDKASLTKDGKTTAYKSKK